jgi:hypothetical protein
MLRTYTLGSVRGESVGDRYPVLPPFWRSQTFDIDFSAGFEVVPDALRFDVQAHQVSLALPIVHEDSSAMKQCSYCGREHPDEASICSVDASPLVRSTRTSYPGSPIRQTAISVQGFIRFIACLVGMSLCTIVCLVPLLLFAQAGIAVGSLGGVIGIGIMRVMLIPALHRFGKVNLPGVIAGVILGFLMGMMILANILKRN